MMDPVLFFPVAVALALTPGPNNFCALDNGLRQGVSAALVGTFGRVAAFSVFLTVSALGMAAMLMASEFAFNLLKWIGAAYLIWLGVCAWRSKIDFSSTMQPGSLRARSMRALVLQEFLLGISNPKAILLFAAVFPQFIDPAHPAPPQFLVLGTTYLAAEFVSSLVYGIGGRQLRRLITSPKGASCINKVTGGVFVGAGGILLSTER
jgi:homoserine/homoserine lactone efflux protein